MRIKSLQVHGFKSFVDPTTFTFKDGITAVVGPNGCGKSNVVDAVRWVMGEQSAQRLRGKGMDDVIFAGSENRPPIGMAEVILTFENTEGRAPGEFSQFSEIQICRRLYRSGESEYLINKSSARLKDVQDFFRDTGIGAKGYTIVEQGKVAEIVSAKAADRRLLIEEAAGITKYKARRREAEGKIRSTEQNLQRVNDVLAEIRRQISSLERQARKAARYKRLRETQRILELSLAADERDQLLKCVGESKSRMEGLQDSVTALSTRVAQRELALEEKRIGLTEAEKAVSRGSERLYALRSEIKNIQGSIELGEREREGIAESNEARRQEVQQLREQLSQTQAEAVQARLELEQLEANVESQRATVVAAESEATTAQEEIAEAERERETVNARFVDILTSIARGEDRLAALADRREEIDQRLRMADREYEERQTATHRAQGEQDNIEEGLRNLLSERERFQEQLIVAMRRHERANQKLKDAGDALRELRERGEARKARLQSLRELIEANEDAGSGTRHILAKGEEARSRYGARGLVREFLDVEREALRAVGAVLAERADALLVGEGKQATDALEALRGEGAGKGIFLVEPPEVPSTGIVPLGRPLLEFVSAHPGHESLARNLLGDIYVVETLSEVFEVYGSGVLPATFVTFLGDVVDPSGIVRGGSLEAAGTSLERMGEVRELEAEVESLVAEVHEFETAHAEAERGLQEATQELDNLRNRHHTAALAVANHEKDLERTAERVKTLGEAQQTRVAERSDLIAEAEALAAEEEGLTLQVEDSRQERIRVQSGLDGLGLRLGSLGREFSRRQTRVTELRVVHEGRLEARDRLGEIVSRADNSSRETADWIGRRESEIATGVTRSEDLVAQAEEARIQLEERIASEEEARVETDSLRDAYELESTAVGGLDDELRDIRGELGGRQEEATSAELSLRESQLRLDHQIENIRERWQVDITNWQLPSLEPAAAEPEASGADPSAADLAEAAVAARIQGANPASAEAQEGPEDSPGALREARRNLELAHSPSEEREGELENIRKALQSLGDVNVGAIEEHEELAERFRFLSEQRADLEQTIESLREAITRINRTSRRRFRETFEQVSKRFSENFPRLFGGGKASLQLTESEDILEAGIDIMAMPPGKRLQNVNLLSGGEKTMTALALLVAVFQVRPSPFFLLDEVDAALDDANVGRFNGLITDMADASQFLVITHNKRTIEVADVLCGVTMEKKGVSKLVGVELN